MEARDEIIQDIYMSSKSFIDFYSKIFIPKLKAENINQVKIKNLNNQLTYNYLLLIKCLKRKPLFSIFKIKKWTQEGKTYDQVNSKYRLIVDYTEKKHLIKNDPADFLACFLKLKEELICMIAKSKSRDLNAIAIFHNEYGFVTPMELIYLIISSNYQYIEICKKVLVRRMVVAV